VISSSQRALTTQHTTNTRDKGPNPQRDSNPAIPKMKRLTSLGHRNRSPCICHIAVSYFAPGLVSSQILHKRTYTQRHLSRTRTHISFPSYIGTCDYRAKCLRLYYSFIFTHFYFEHKINSKIKLFRVAHDVAIQL
jgi:hypothetical protein